MQVILPITSIISQARQGVLRRRVDEVARLVGLTDKEMARILNMSIRSLHGKATATRLSLAAIERLLLLKRLVQRELALLETLVHLPPLTLAELPQLWAPPTCFLCGSGSRQSISHTT